MTQGTERKKKRKKKRNQHSQSIFVSEIEETIAKFKIKDFVIKCHVDFIVLNLETKARE